jgi:hypothetical protein
MEVQAIFLPPPAKKPCVLLVDPISDGLADSAHHDEGKSNRGQPQTAALMFEQRWIAAIISKDKMPSRVDLESYPIAEEE